MPARTSSSSRRTSSRAPSSSTASAAPPGLNSVVWGGPMWDLLFTLAFRIDEACHPDALTDFRELCMDLEHALPCATCKESYGKFLKRVPPTFAKKSDVTKWLWTVKDMVNQKLNKAYVPYATVRDRYAHYRSLVSDTTVLELVLLCLQHNDVASAPRIVSFAKRVGRLGRGVFALRACDALEQMTTCGETIAHLQATVRQMSYAE